MSYLPLYFFFQNSVFQQSLLNLILKFLCVQVNELSEEEEEDEKLEHIEELPEEGVEKSAGMPEVLQLRMTENLLDSDSVTASTR